MRAGAWRVCEISGDCDAFCTCCVTRRGAGYGSGGKLL